MEKLTKKVQSKCNKIIKKFSPRAKNEAVLALQQCNEFLLSLDRRYRELLKVEKEILNFNPKNRDSRSLNEMQLDYVDKTHAFHQQIYSTISSLVKLLSHIGNDVFKQRFLEKKCIGSVEKFLENFRDTEKKVEYLDLSLDLLLHSRKYRTDFVDHTQQNKIHTWITQSLSGAVAIIYFRFPEGKIPMPNPLINPYFINEDDVFVPKHHTWVYNSLVNLVEYSLYIVSKKKYYIT